VLFVDEYPTTSTGKIRRVELRDMAQTVLLDDRAEGRAGAAGRQSSPSG
jgi:acyl-coenzyme A synthetase/AMP-(fatty) acid ligase